MSVATDNMAPSNSEESSDLTPNSLLKSAREGNVELLKKVIELQKTEPAQSKFDLNFKDTPQHNGVAALHYAAFNGYFDYLKLLLEQGAEVDVTDLESATPLHHAAFSGHIECVKALLDAGANPDHRDSEGCTPLHKASQCFHHCVLTFEGGLYR